MTHRFASRGFFAQRLGAYRVCRWLAAVPVLALGACNHYDFGDIIDAIDGGHSQGGSAGTGGHGGGCVVDGQHHPEGASFASSDGCNTCSCGEDGQVACTLRFCAATCGGITGQGCADGEYCSFPPEAECGAADQTGFCSTQPEFCTLEFNPVCGCDGVTYGNACEAAAAGVSVVSEGECASAVECQSDWDCPVPSCACLDENQDGQCENDCPAPVCRDGVCGLADPNALQLGETCGGFRPASSPDCDAGLFCQHQAGALCGAADAPGECASIPEVCTDQYDPVCGCDGQTYGNACYAAANRMGIFELGECP
jgi:hypothetical protein